MNYNEPDEIKWERRIDEIDTELAAGDVDNRDELEKEKSSLRTKLDARDEFDRNERNGMSSTDQTISNGRPDSHPLKKLKDRITGDKKPEKPEQSDEPEQPPPHDHEKHQSRPEPDTEQQQSNPESNETGIRTIPVVEVTVVPGPHTQTGGGGTNQQQPQQMRSLGRQSYQRAYMNTPNIWQYPSSRHDTNQVGLVQQSYKSYFGLP